MIVGKKARQKAIAEFIADQRAQESQQRIDDAYARADRQGGEVDVAEQFEYEREINGVRK